MLSRDMLMLKSQLNWLAEWNKLVNSPTGLAYAPSDLTKHFVIPCCSSCSRWSVMCQQHLHFIIVLLFIVGLGFGLQALFWGFRDFLFG